MPKHDWMTQPRYSVDRGHWRKWVFLLLLLPIVGCDGCRRRDQPEEDPDKPPEPEVVSSIVRVMPSHQDHPVSVVKPGHWSAAYQEHKSTRQDFRGDLNLHLRRGADGAISLPGSDAGLKFRRPAALAKGQTKRFDMRFYAPTYAGEGRKTISLRSEFNSRQGLSFHAGDCSARVMKPEEYYFVVLTSRPTEFSYISDDDWQQMKTDALTSNDDRESHYRVVVPKADGVLPIPDSFLQWTAIAYVLWDDLSPDALTYDQQEALVDWVHWGGRIILNGPASTADFRGTALESLVPFEPGNASELAGQDVIGLVSHWGLKKGREKDAKIEDTTGNVVSSLRQIDSMIGCDGALKSGAREIAGTGGLVVEQTVGRGNIVATRFDLTAGWLRKWESASGFYNGALLRRPPRDYRAQDYGYKAVFSGANMPERMSRESQLITGLRVASRDISLYSFRNESEEKPRQSKNPWINRHYEASTLGGIGSWNDDSGVCTEVRGMLQEAAGISIPPVSFVGRSLFWYLMILVPGNYLIFRILRRLEWAWIAVPVLATAGAIWIARSAQLDIGFARSRNEFAVLELQGGYSRGHATRLFALYNSLSTTYEIDFETRDGIAAPLSQGTDTQSVAETFIQYNHGFDSGVQVNGISIDSNNTKLLHAEHMIPLTGAISVNQDQSRLTNATEFALEDVVVAQRGTDGQLRQVGIGPLQAGETVDLEYRDVENIMFRSEVPKETSNLMRLVLGAPYLRPGEIRLVGRYVEGSLPGVEIVPAASQISSQSVVVVNLSETGLPAAEKDIQIRPKAEVMGEDFDTGELDETES